MPVGDPVVAVYDPTHPPEEHTDHPRNSSYEADSLHPTDLPGVGAGTAAIINGSSFTAADIVTRNVSYTMLLDAGVKERIADDLRREYSLVWSFVWTDNPDLRERASRLKGLSDAEREWIAASSPPNPDGEQTSTGETVQRVSTRPIDVPGPDARPAETENDACPQCGTTLSRYSLGARTTTACEACGFTGLPVQ